MRHALYSLQFRLSALVFMFGVVLIYYSYRRYEERDVAQRKAQIIESANAEGTRLSGLAQHLFRRHLPITSDLVMSYASVAPELRLGLICDDTGVVRHTSRQQWRGVQLAETPLGYGDGIAREVRTTMAGRVVDVPERQVVLAAFPFVASSDTGASGVVLLEYDLHEPVEAARAAALHESVPLALMLLAACLLLWMVLRELITSRVGRIVAQTESIATGEALKQPLQGKDELARLSQSFTDASARLRDLAGELSQRNKDMEAFIYAVSHDLRAPLVNIQGFARAVDEDVTELLGGDGSAGQSPVSLREGIASSVESIRNSAVRMDELLKGLLAFSRVGRETIEVRRLDAGTVVQESVDALKFQFQQAGACVEVERLPACLGDPPLLGRVFANLLENALKYRHPDRPLVVKVSGRLEQEWVTYLVEDNGIGIRSDQLERVFGLFHRLHSNMGEGHGLGLAIVRRAMEKQGGSVWAQSVVGQGTAFYLRLRAPAH